MADHMRWDETTTKRIYALKSPTNWVEVQKVLSALRHDLKARKFEEYDDTVTVEAYDDEIRFSFEFEKSIKTA